MQNYTTLLSKELPSLLAEMSKLKPKSMTRFYNLIAGRFRAKTVIGLDWTWGITLALLMTVGITNSYTQCHQSNMACNDFVQVSLDDNCELLVTPDMILEGFVGDSAEYRVTIWDGSIPLGDQVNDTYVNRRLEVSVRCLANGVSCWGYIGIEDKVPPVVEIFPPMVTIPCSDADDNLSNPYAYVDTFLINNGGCEKIDSPMIMETIMNENGSCGINGIVRTVTRVFVVTDNAGNTSTATQVIQVMKAEMEEVVFPRDTVISCVDLPANGFDPDVFGRPEAMGCDIFKSTYSDNRFPLCPGSIKILRTWTTVDWCDGRDTTVFQTLESIDTVAPIWNMNFETMEGSTSTGSQACLGMITIPLEEYAAATDLCYALQTDDYSITYKLGDETNPSGFEDRIRTDVFIEADGDAVISDLPLGTHMIVVTATDACGNSSTGSRLFNISDMTPPNAVCERITTAAIVDETELAEVMAITFDDHSFDNCSIDRFEVKRLLSTCDGFEGELAFGPSVHFCCEDIENNPIKVVLRVYDHNDEYSECIVDVEVQDKREVSITCRPGITVNCDFNFDNLATRLGMPTINANVCNIEEAVLRPFTPVVDSCGNGQFTVTWVVSDLVGPRDSCMQTVTVRNQSAPSITLPGNINVEACDASQAHPKFIESEPIVSGRDCEMIASSWTDDVDTIPNSGCIRITRRWTVIDWCTFDPTDNTTILRQGNQTVTLVDNTAPQFLECSSDFEVIDSDDNCEQDVLLSILATDNCTLSDDLSYSYEIDLFNNGSVDDTGTGKNASNTFEIGTHSIVWTVTDRCGNTNSSCSYTFTVSKVDGGTCDETNVNAALIQGALNDENQVEVPSVNILLTDQSTGQRLTVETDENGEYLFNDLKSGNNYTIDAHLEGNDVVGISGLDLILMQRHILGLSTFESPYQLIAADANGSGSITASDVISLQRLLLGFDTNMGVNDPWKFIPSDYPLTLNDPYSYPSVFNTGALTDGVNNFDFVGVKVGDVDGNAFPALLNILTGGRSRMDLNYQIGKVSDDLYKVDFSLDAPMDVTGIQLSIDASDIALIDRDNGSLELTNSNVAYNDDEIKVTWIDAHGISLDESTLFSFLISGKDIDELQLGQSLKAEIYDANLNQYSLSLSKELDLTEKNFELFQNQPNPFHTSTNVSFMIPNRDEVTLTVYDMTGKVILQKNKTFEQGINTFQVHRNEIKSAGVLYYTIETSSEVKGQRMILLH